MTDLYADFSTRYDLPYGLPERPDPVMAEFFNRIFAEHHVKRVLDCACGTGRHLRLLHHLGYVAYGSDISPSMLTQAEKNLADAGVSIPLRQADFRCLPDIYLERFDAVTCLGGIVYMQDDAQALKAFESMAGVLCEDGILVLSAIPTDRQWHEKPKFTLAADTSSCTRIFAMDYFERTVRYNILDLLRYPGGSEMKVWSVEITPLLRDDQERLLKTAGYRQVDFFGGYDFSPYDKVTSNLMITVARK